MLVTYQTIKLQAFNSKVLLSIQRAANGGLTDWWRSNLSVHTNGTQKSKKIYDINFLV